MSRFSGSQYRGAMRAYRLEARARAEERQAAERERDAAREQERRRHSKVVWNSRAGRAWKAHTTHVDAKMAERRRAR